MNEKTLNILKQSFKEYYYKNAEKVETPTRINEREFGYILFGKTMTRHLSFQQEGDLRAFLVKEAPSDIYYSIGYYFEPTLPMNEKGWKEADLVFDIDADDIPTPCKSKHDNWVCKGCGYIGKGRKPTSCVKCGENRFEEQNWVCNECLEFAKNETLKLIDMLKNDFGINENEIKIYFSGNMGYHVVVEDRLFRRLDQLARNEISDYISGNNLTPENIGIFQRTSYEDIYKKIPLPNDPGWRGRIARYLQKLSEDNYEDFKIKFMEIYNRERYKGFKILMRDVAKKMGAVIDTSVTTDIHRIFRLPGTLHGETGLFKKRVLDLIGFNPLSDAVVLSEEPINVFVDYSPEFILKNQTYGPFRSQKVVLPLMAAIFLIGRRVAKVI